MNGQSPQVRSQSGATGDNTPEMPLLPAQSETRAIPVGGPRHYPVKTCAERGFHVVRKIESAFSAAFKCAHCRETGPENWARIELRKEGDFYLELGEAIEDLARTQIREHRTIFDSSNVHLNEAAERAGGKQ
jgi:hypothetical protein